MYYPWEAAIVVPPQPIPTTGSAIIYLGRLELAIPDDRLGIFWKYPFSKGTFFMYPTVPRFGDAFNKLYHGGVLAKYGVCICRETQLHEVVTAMIGQGEGIFERVYISMMTGLIHDDNSIRTSIEIAPTSLPAQVMISDS